MEGLEENRKKPDQGATPPDQGATPPDTGAAAPPTARHRNFWRGLGNGMVVLFTALMLTRVRYIPEVEYARNIQLTQPEMFVRYALECLPRVCLMGALYIISEQMLRAYCFARAETTERIRLFDYLLTEPARRRLAKDLYQTVWVLLGVLSLLTLYGFLSDPW